MKKYIITVLAFIFIFAQLVYTQDMKNEIINLDKNFYANLLKASLIKRDAMLNDLSNKILHGYGYVESTDSKERYHRKFRIKLIDSEANNINIRVYIFTDKEDYLTLLKKGDLFEYKGQFVVATPLNSRRDLYIFDIILEDGALVM